MAALGATVPGSDKSGSGKPLYPYVCDLDDGWERTEPQESRSESELVVASLLYE